VGGRGWRSKPAAPCNGVAQLAGKLSKQLFRSFRMRQLAMPLAARAFLLSHLFTYEHARGRQRYFDSCPRPGMQKNVPGKTAGTENTPYSLVCKKTTAIQIFKYIFVFDNDSSFFGEWFAKTFLDRLKPTHKKILR